MMDAWGTGQWLLYGGLVAMGAAVACGLAALVGFTVSGRRLRRLLQEEYGEPYHGGHGPQH